MDGQISPEELRLLKQRIAATDFGAIRPAPPTQIVSDFCLLPVDGPETIYTFWTGAQNDNQVEEIRGCTAAIDGNSALFQQLERLYSEISTQAVASPITNDRPEHACCPRFCDRGRGISPQTT
jgi:hypothetical protein